MQSSCRLHSIEKRDKRDSNCGSKWRIFYQTLLQPENFQKFQRAKNFFFQENFPTKVKLFCPSTYVSMSSIMQLHGKLPSGLPRETVNNLFQLYYPEKKKEGNILFVYSVQWHLLFHQLLRPIVCKEQKGILLIVVYQSVFF